MASKLGSTRPKQTAQPKEDREYRCVRCGKSFTVQKNNFNVAQSVKYRGNNGYLDVCKNCIEEEYFHYYGQYDDIHKAVRRMCMSYDVFYDEDYLDNLLTTNSGPSVISTYFGRIHMGGRVGKTYDDTLDAEAFASEQVVQSVDHLEMLNETLETQITPEIVEFWGTGFSPEDYEYLDKRYKYWTSRNECETVAQESIFMKICLAEWRITKDAQAGLKIDSLLNAFNNMLDSGNLKPKQVSAENAATSAQLDKMTLGMGIKKWEETRPVPEPLEEFKDVNGIVKYITIWFYGHLAKMMRKKNAYSKMYEEEMERFRIERPEYEGDYDELLDEVLGGDADD